MPPFRIDSLGLASLLVFAVSGCSTPEPDTVEEYRARYSNRLISPGAQFAALPPAVQNTIRAQAGSADIAQIDKDTSLEPRVIYRVYFDNSDLFQPLIVAPDGSLLDPDLTVAMGAPMDDWSIQTGSGYGGGAINDLPQAAVKTIHHVVPDGLVDTVTRQVLGNQVSYVVTFRNNTHAPIHIAGDGTILTDH